MIKVDGNFCIEKTTSGVFYVLQFTCKRKHFELEGCYVAGASPKDDIFNVYNEAHNNNNPFGCNTNINKETINKIKFMLGMK